MSEKIRIHLRKFDLRTISAAAAAAQAPVNIIIIGASSSRKVACVCDAIKGSGGVVVANRNANIWEDCRRFKIVPEITQSLVSRTKYRVIDDPNVDLRALKEVLTTGQINVVCMSEYPNDRSFAKFATYVIMLGGLTQTRSVWSDFGVLVPKYKDFKQIYLACTDEGDRYSDGFLIIHNDPLNKDPSEIFSWGSIHISAVKDITIDVERQTVRASKQKVEPVSAVAPSTAVVANTAEIKEPCAPEEPQHEVKVEPVQEPQVIPEQPQTSQQRQEEQQREEQRQEEQPRQQEEPYTQEREPRADCTIM